MSSFEPCRRSLAMVLALALFLVSLPLGALQAGLVSTEEVVAGMRADDDRARIEAFLEREEVEHQLESLGVEPGEAQARIASLSDAEIQTIAGELDRLPAGEGAFGTFFIAAGVILLILVLTDILGITDVFTFVR